MIDIVVGFDPGKTGALVVFIDDKLHTLFGMPLLPDGRIDCTKVHGLFHRLNGFYSDDPHITTVIENVHSMPSDAKPAAFTFGRNLGKVEGIAEALSHKVVYVTPQAWKKYWGLKGKDKEAAIGLVETMMDGRRTFSTLPKYKKLGLSDAYLIAKHYLETRGD